MLNLRFVDFLEARQTLRMPSCHPYVYCMLNLRFVDFLEVSVKELGSRT